MVSKRFMVSDTNTKKRNHRFSVREKTPGRMRFIGVSALARAIFLSNMVGLLILIIGALTLNEVRGGLISTKLQSLYSQGGLITSIMASDASGTDAIPSLDEDKAREIMARIDLPAGTRARLWDSNGQLLADSEAQSTAVEVEEFPFEDEVDLTFAERVEKAFTGLVRSIPSVKKRRESLRRDLRTEVQLTLVGNEVTGERYTEDGELIVIVNRPVRRVGAVLGVVTLESYDIEQILSAERRSLTPIIGLAFITALLSSIALTLYIALPIRSLARAAVKVQSSGSNRGVIPDLSGRRDEIGDLSVLLRNMTDGLYSRIDDIANFAADVAHEIKNPLTSLRSATETLERAKTAEQRDKLIGIIQNDVGRMDRLISDISKASRMDAELAREEAGPIEVEKMLQDMVDMYQTSGFGEDKTVRYIESDETDREPLVIRGSASTIGQVFSNLIDNALTFSPEGGEVRLRARVGTDEDAEAVVITVDDDGPGIPPANLNSIFQRFYTDRPKGAAFGTHSGLGLAICRQIVRAHKGRIFAENRMGAEGKGVSGAKFTIIIPKDYRRSSAQS